MIAKIIAGIIGGFVVAFLVGNLLNLAFNSSQMAAVAFLLAWAIAIVGALRAPRGAKAWRWLLIVSGALTFLMPFAILIFSTRPAEAGRVVVGLLVTGLVWPVFFLVGLAFFVIGLLIGRDKRPITPGDAVSGHADT